MQCVLTSLHPQSTQHFFIYIVLQTLDVARQVQKIAEKLGIVVAESAQFKGDGPKIITAKSAKRMGGELGVSQAKAA
jgi:hypothetical protein